MATGADIKLEFNTLIDEAYTDYWTPSQLNIFFKSAINSITNDIVKDFESNRVDLGRILPLVNISTVSNPVNNAVNISQSSSQVVSCKQVVFIKPTFASGITVRTTPLPLKDFGAIYSSGTVRYPKYTQTNGVITIYPLTIAVTTVDVYYIRNPFYIDVSDNATVVPYNDEMVQLVIKGAIAEATRSSREYSLSGIETQIVNAEVK